ncbi:alpha/beta hydrolase [Lactiplantibacillus daowaiensis]|uniref:Alpha/beta hydrolase n=1 Tax=Lactiplantibacillus daowaiensis TaxID=2559918 RepID=A0ABW1RWX0_9LACO|nr:alpha/beta hydrolase [Lactiplantibacillus daowaiensis]
MKRKTKVLCWSLGVVIILLGIGLGVFKAKEYQPSSAATNAATSAKITKKYTVFKGQSTKPAVIFYPGALVAPNSYSVWARQLAKHGYTVYLMHFPLDLAVLAGNRAAAVPTAARKNYVIGGHSLGGVMASRYAAVHPKGLMGIFYLASYPDKKGSLKATTLPALSVTASRDGVLNWTSYRQSKHYLPAETQFVTLKGGNHAGFGSYGHQKGDHTATISTHRQQQLVETTLLQWLRQLK